MLYSGTDPESYITEYTLVYEDNKNEMAGSEMPAFVVLSGTKRRALEVPK